MFKKNMPKRLLFFFLFFLLKASFSLADTNVNTYCNNAISQNLLHKINNTKPQLIEIKINKYRKWRINQLRLTVDLYKQGVRGIIYEKYKKNFDAMVHVKFDDKIKCSFQAKVRQHGDYLDHAIVIDEQLHQSIDVDLKNGHINGITKFILLLPTTRKNPEEEIILTELLRTLGYLSPRTSFVNVKLNNLNLVMLFQEKAEKELLEYHLRREGPILEGDERIRENFGARKTRIALARQSNINWAAKSIKHQDISHEALTRLNWFYLLNKNSLYEAKNLNKLYNINLDNNLLALNNPTQILKLDVYNAILWGANGYHGLIPLNRKYYWNAINNYFEPIYYDGDLTINDGYSILENWELVSFPDKNSFLIGIKEAQKKIIQIEIENFFKRIKSQGSLLSKNEAEEIINQIVKNLSNLETDINNGKHDKELQNQNVAKNDKTWTNYIDYSLKTINSDLFIVFRDSKNKSFKVCSNKTLNCKKTSFTKDEIIDLLRGRLLINNNIYQYIGEYSGVEDELVPSKLNMKQLLKYNNIKLLNTNFYFDKNITFEYDKENSIFNIYQKYSGARVYFRGGSLNNVLINFFGLPDAINKPLNNYPFDNKGLTGCMSFVDLKFQNVSIKSYNSNCEDSVNLINTTGYIKKFESKNSVKDALDIDFSNIKIGKVFINKAGNDCVDLSRGEYEFGELNLSECDDKALSVGEKSFVKLKNFQVLQSKIGLSSKDSSIIHIENAIIKNTELCLEAKRKKQEFSGGIINLKNHNCNDSPINIHSGSFINYY